MNNKNNKRQRTKECQFLVSSVVSKSTGTENQQSKLVLVIMLCYLVCLENTENGDHIQCPMCCPAAIAINVCQYELHCAVAFVRT